MILRDISFDLPYIANEYNVLRIMNEKNCLRTDATKLDYEQNWKENRRKFTLQTRCISSMFLRLMGKVVTQNSKKLLIECFSYEPEEISIKNCLGITEIKLQFDWVNFLSLDDCEKKKRTLDMIMKALKYLSQNERLDYEHFVDVYDRILQLDYINQWIWKSIKNSNKQSAELLITHNIEEVIFTVIIKNKNGDIIKTEEILRELPDEFVYAPHLGSLSWLSNNEVMLKSKIKDQVWCVRI